MKSSMLLKDPPRLECYVHAAKRYPDCDAQAMHCFSILKHTVDTLWKVESKHYISEEISQGRFLIMMLLMDKTNDLETSEGIDVATDISKIASLNPRTPAELANLAQITRASVSGLLDSLEKEGLVRREHDTKDRRQVIVHLTEKGQTFIESFLPPYFKLISDLMRPLELEERMTLVALLEKLKGGAKNKG
jgi:DNA-binding MarR family transcriptional regulator